MATATANIRRIKLDMVLAATSLARGKVESADSYLKRVTHLHLQGKKIKYIENLDQCTNLKVLYLYDNTIEQIENLSFSKALSYLYLQNNLIARIPSLDLSNLFKLYLDDNEIQYVSGLEACVRLEELHLANQRLPSFTSLQFDTVTLDALSGTLQVLEISGNSVTTLEPFVALRNLRKLFAENNMIGDLSSIEMIVSLRYVEEVKFTGNPCSKVQKYRDNVIGASSDSLKFLDDLPILKHQQVAMRGLKVHRHKIRAITPFKGGGNFGDGFGSESLADQGFADSATMGEFVSGTNLDT